MTVNSSTEKSAQGNVFKRKRLKLSRLKRRFLKNVWVARGLLIALVLTVFGGAIYLVSILLAGTGFSEAMKAGGAFLLPKERKIRTFEGRTNILLLGKSGKGDDSPDLTDTMIFVSLDYGSRKVDMISIPRDIWVADLRAKINSAYYWGNQKAEGGGLILAKSVVEGVVGVPVHYGVVVDFDSFEEIVDVLGGVEVEVERSFVDEKYPIAGREDDDCDGDALYGCRYETIAFSEGLQVMDGETALKFVRSRNAEGDEGTDLARGARQQKVIGAILKKVVSPAGLGSVGAFRRILLENVETDMSVVEVGTVGRLIFDGKDLLKSHTISEEYLSVAPKSLKYDNLYVFLFNEKEVHEWVKEILQ